MAEKSFVHILLFECPQCGSPIESTITTLIGNPEEIDAQEFKLRCNCSWTGKSHGFAAKRRVMVGWNAKEDLDHGTFLGSVRGIKGGTSSHALRTEN